MKKIYKTIDEYVFILTNILFSLIPLVLILGGGIFSISFIFKWYFDGKIVFNDIWYILLGLLFCWMGSKWDDVIIEHYDTSIERKRNKKERAEIKNNGN